MYRPSYNPADVPLTSLVRSDQTVTVEAREEEALKVLQTRTKERAAGNLYGSVGADGGTSALPLTLEQAEAIEEQKLLLLKEIQTTRERVAQLQNSVDEGVRLSGLAINFSIDLKKRGRLRRALKKAMNYEGDELTYEMYRAALAARSLLEKMEAADYTSGKWSNDDGVSDESSSK